MMQLHYLRKKERTASGALATIRQKGERGKQPALWEGNDCAERVGSIVDQPQTL
jgi:hypothetical protein